ncbi:endonuclease/exonuclease/phosphatase family protein [Ciceribacter ferrooxidans]|uniref:Endonuclease/exonuclease/phosphatase family protein n=1 Tax=Ciceribacter ferrooxidans TaxID=2509717 RepID=A0A4Q2T8R3_9HYPH|nr:endonuclease/exonuclease/phosphatase family protein [Ciceribacter ferrooxidans]RYC15283.1 endonuclease/exonuclease/phosphatase family protein [Ciceribacter ferrooxidans]
MVVVSTFNVENLFSRPKVLNMADHAQAAEILKRVNRLSELLDMRNYRPYADEIRALYVELKDYVTINIRSSRVGRNILTADGDLIAKGREDWDGFVDLERERFSEEQIRFTGKVIKEVEPDIQCFVEVESAGTLARFNTDILNSWFKDKIVVDGNDPRGIDVALASRALYPIRTAKTNVFARDSEGVIFSRDCLEVEIDIDGRSLYILVNHFKAKDATPAVSDHKRMRQAKEVAQILKTRYDLSKDLVLVAGDFNDEPDSGPLEPLLAAPELTNVLDVLDWPADDRWTYYYGKKHERNAIDYILVSDALKPFVKRAGFERRGIAGLDEITGGAESSFPGITSWKLAASDHAALWVELDL